MTALRLQIPEKFEPWLKPCRHKVAEGGRGSAKSRTISQLLVAKLYERPLRWLCTREIQQSLKYSVHSLLADEIKRTGLGGFYDVQATTIKGVNGSEFIFSGLREHTVESIKSFENCDGAWVEEASAVSATSANVLIPTIRKEGSEIWWSYNPNEEDDYVHTMKGDDVLRIQVNWRDNPWFPDVLNRERLKLREVNEDLYQHVWEGKCRSRAGILFKRKWFKEYTELPKNLSVYMASDYAGAPDIDSERDSDFNEMGVFGLTEDGDCYIIDWFSEQCDPETMIDGACSLIRRRKPNIWFEEKGVILRAIDAAIRKRLRQKDIRIFRKALASAGSKAERALGFAAMASAGQVYVPRGTPWAERLVNQLCAFTGEDGKVDDGVDVCSLLARGLDSMKNARAPEPADELGTPGSYAFLDKWEASERERRARKFR